MANKEVIMEFLEVFQEHHRILKFDVARKNHIRGLMKHINNQEDDEISKKAKEVWNAMVAEYGAGFDKPNDETDVELIEMKMTEPEANLINMVRQSVAPVLEDAIDLNSKKSQSAMRKFLSLSSSKIKDALGNRIQGFVLYSQDPDFKKENYDPNEYAQLLSAPNNGLTKIDGVKTKHSDKISTIQIDFEPDTPPQDKKYIIHFNGNAEHAIDYVDEMTAEAKQHQCVVINFDYPGVGESEGKSKRSKHLVEAGLAQVERLKQMGVPPENIVLKGHSLGGAVATVTAAKLHKQGDKVALYNDRSFSKTSVFATQIGIPGLGHIAAGLVKAAGWELNAIKAWKQIPEAYKDFCFAVNDKVIPPATHGLAGALGKMDDNDRKVQTFRHPNTDITIMDAQNKNPWKLAGHNEALYNEHVFHFKGGNTLNAQAINANGKPMKEMFDSFASKMFANTQLNLNPAQKQQASDLLAALQSFNAQPSPASKGILTFRQNVSELQKASGKKAPEIIKLLETIKENGKVTEKQLSDIQHFCQHVQKKAGKNPSPKVNEFLQKANNFISNTVPPSKEQTAKMSHLSR